MWRCLHVVLKSTLTVTDLFLKLLQVKATAPAQLLTLLLSDMELHAKDRRRWRCEPAGHAHIKLQKGVLIFLSLLLLLFSPCSVLKIRANCSGSVTAAGFHFQSM